MFSVLQANHWYYTYSHVYICVYNQGISKINDFIYLPREAIDL